MALGLFFTGVADTCTARGLKDPEFRRSTGFRGSEGVRLALGLVPSTI